MRAVPFLSVSTLQIAVHGSPAQTRSLYSLPTDNKVDLESLRHLLLYMVREMRDPSITGLPQQGWVSQTLCLQSMFRSFPESSSKVSHGSSSRQRSRKMLLYNAKFYSKYVLRCCFSALCVARNTRFMYSILRVITPSADEPIHVIQQSVVCCEYKKR